ncbi:MAG TPA: hypothetical protein VFQ23_13650, partial [Anaerolineales bacterium]|nr:hypothetical protein [Anaerolineales bacterium]
AAKRFGLAVAETNLQNILYQGSVFATIIVLEFHWLQDEDDCKKLRESSFQEVNIKTFIEQVLLGRL